MLEGNTREGGGREGGGGRKREAAGIYNGGHVRRKLKQTLISGGESESNPRECVCTCREARDRG